jgi:hypothetical protein
MDSTCTRGREIRRYFSPSVCPSGADRVNKRIAPQKITELVREEVS